MESTPSTAVLTGTFRQPELVVHFDPEAIHPSNGHKTMLEWVKWLPGAWFSREDFGWRVFGTGRNPDEKFRLAGVTVDFTSRTQGTDLEGTTSLDELVDPIAKLSGNGQNVFIRHRLLGYDATKVLLGSAQRWERDHKRFVIPVADALHRGAPRPGIYWSPEIIDAAVADLNRVTTNTEVARHAAEAGMTSDLEHLDPETVRKLVDVVGDIPDWFGLDLYPFQRAGSIAVAAGHSGLFDQPGLGKTRQGIAGAAVVRSRRTLITTLPVGLTGWTREVSQSGLATLGGNLPDGKVVTFHAAKKEPELPESGVVIVADSLISSRPELRQKLINWAPDVMLIDEAHRMKNLDSARSAALLDVGAATTRLRVAITGTPLFQSADEMAPLLMFTGHMGPIFGGLDAYRSRYCKEDKFGRWNTRRENLGELKALLARHVWVRRTKDQVLPDLPKASLVGKFIDVPLAGFRKSHKDVTAVIAQWVKDVKKETGADPTQDMITDFSYSQVSLVSLLRKAAGIAKIEDAIGMIRQHVTETSEIDTYGHRTFQRPLIVWVHHKDVAQALIDAYPIGELGNVGVIRGGSSQADRDSAVADFQAGKLGVIICSIAAAGVAITLTASSDMFFVESSYTPAEVRQAIDRAVRIGQKNAVTATVLLAEGTLDASIQKALQRKSVILDAVLEAGNDVSVGVDLESDDQTAAGIIRELVSSYLTTGKKTTAKAPQPA